MRDQLQPTFSTCIDLSHQKAFYKNNHLAQPHSSPKPYSHNCGLHVFS